MIRTLLAKSFFVSILALGNMSFLMWLINDLHLAQLPQAKSLISAVQADTSNIVEISANPQLATDTTPQTQTQVDAQTGVTQTQVVTRDGAAHILLHFAPGQAQLQEAERLSFEGNLLGMQLTRGHQVVIYAGPLNETTGHATTPQVAKLRAQNIARVIFPYTQNIRISLSPVEAQTGLVRVEMTPPSRAQASVTKNSGTPLSATESKSPALPQI